MNSPRMRCSGLADLPVRHGLEAALADDHSECEEAEVVVRPGLGRSLLC